MDRKASRIRRQFNRSAEGAYDANAHVQRLMAEWLDRSLQQEVNSVGDFKPDILEIGCGTGNLTERLLHGWPWSSLTALDLAPAMLQAAETRVAAVCANSSAARVRFLLEDVEAWAPGAPSASLDLIVSSACFQWLRRPKETLGELRRLLRPGGLLAFTTFGPGTFRELHESFGRAYRAAGMEPRRHGLSFPSAEQWQSLLQANGFENVQLQQTTQVELHFSVRAFLQSVKAVGASVSEASASPGIGSRRLFERMFEHYEEAYRVQGGIQATYELLLIHAAAPRY
ncbi:malonyl-ACP O-methyltransferase BioC [Paenibacillus soyae]|uniref:Malonyl-[acyl-carrier protein] O-methyltransferase n=1 Tax=Paenibacillus soyae TaxID=2969249 RepID=A0A9X2SB18_9BACL|nr:malonyl-ACP O-methyltransferase BioC [Paenibacillus soyae]MCR2805208.1 malonyl-ACP O-methyltransferase BioC [Paenibacillus soyae]